MATLAELGLSGSRFILGDGCELDKGAGLFDMALTCPPYWNLEQYSDLKEDLSNLKTYNEFDDSMHQCAFSHRRHMKPGAFVCIVVGPFRDKKGELIDFPAHTVGNFRDAGFIYHQQIVLSKNFASAAKRSTNAWKGHKLVPAHEFLLIFRTPK
jgi:DNA modification methylase